tara:strand:+ start:42 stop:185 length:144 start_codon:yes stop_codon:yes gene_type:complete
MAKLFKTYTTARKSIKGKKGTFVISQEIRDKAGRFSVKKINTRKRKK